VGRMRVHGGDRHGKSQQPVHKPIRLPKPKR
jgi:hypothetical protein